MLSICASDVYYSIFPHIWQVFEAKANLNSSEDRSTFLGSKLMTELKKIILSS